MSLHHPAQHHSPRRLRTSLVVALLTAFLVPAATSPGVATAEPGSPPSFTHVPSSIPTAQRALSRAVAVFSGRGDAADASLALRDLSARLPELTGTDRRTAETLLARPNGGRTAVESQLGALWSGSEAASSPVCSSQVPVCVHWTNSGRNQPPTVDRNSNGVYDEVDDTLAVMEHVWRVEVGSLGYRPPLTDERASIDNDGVNFDVYLSDIGDARLYGYCTVDDSRTTRNYRFRDRSAYCVVDDDFSRNQFPRHSPLENLRVTAAHEFFHAVQFAYDAFERPWLLEATAAWMEDIVYDAVNDNRQYLRTSQLVYPNLPLDSSRGGLYRSWIFFRYLSERFGTDIVRTVWNRADGTKNAPNASSVRAVRSALARNGADLVDVYADHVRANLAPANYYDEGTAYPRPLTGLRRLGGQKDSTGWLRASVDHLASVTLELRPNRHANRRAKARVHIDGPGRGDIAQSRVLIRSASGKVSGRRIHMNPKGDATFTIPLGRSQVRGVFVAMVNSAEQRNNQKFLIKATLR